MGRRRIFLLNPTSPWRCATKCEMFFLSEADEVEIWGRTNQEGLWVGVYLADLRI